MRRSRSFGIEDGVYNAFRKLCTKKRWNMSRKIEKYILDLLKTKTPKQMRNEK